MQNRLIIFLLTLLITPQFFPQIVNRPNPDKSDSTTVKIFNPFYDSKPYDPYLFYDNEHKKWQLFVPKYSLKGSTKFQSQGLLLKNLSNQSKWFASLDEFDSYKLSLNILNEIEYKSLMKYDLGVLGKYLGLSRNVMAVILAIISLLKN